MLSLFALLTCYGVEDGLGFCCFLFGIAPWPSILLLTRAATGFTQAFFVIYAPVSQSLQALSLQVMNEMQPLDADWRVGVCVGGWVKVWVDEFAPSSSQTTWMSLLQVSNPLGTTSLSFEPNKTKEHAVSNEFRLCVAGIMLGYAAGIIASNYASGDIVHGWYAAPSFIAAHHTPKCME